MATRIADDEHADTRDSKAIIRVTVPEVFFGVALGKLQRHHAVLHSIEKIENETFCITAEVLESTLKRASWAIVNVSDGRAKVVRVE